MPIRPYKAAPVSQIGSDKLFFSKELKRIEGHATQVADALTAIEGDVTAIEGDITALEAVDVTTDGRLDTLEAGVLTKVGSFTRDTSLANGTAAITGVGFTPKAVLFQAGISSSAFGSIGFDTSSARVGYETNVSGSPFVGLLNGPIVRSASADFVTFQISSMDGDGFTVSYTKGGTPTGTATINYLAIR